MTSVTSRLAMGFSCLGHFYMHFATAMFFTVALALEQAWKMPFYEINELWTWGALFVGLAALPAGRLADRWSARGMMALCILGMGAAMLASGFANGPDQIVIVLAILGIFASIYHPVGIPWLIANAKERTGVALAVNGLFGGLGPAAAALATGFLAEYAGWRWAFFIPGIVMVGTGVVMVLCITTGRLVSTGLAEKKREATGNQGALRVFLILMLTMFVAGVVYNSTQAALPKFFSERLSGFVDGQVSHAAMLVSIVYTVAALMQVLGGMLADRYPLKRVYAIGWGLQIAFLTALGLLSGLPVFVVALLVASTSGGTLPAENMLLFKYAPASHRGLAFGAKYVLAFGAAPLGLQIISFVRDRTGDFTWLFLGLAVAAFLAFIAAVMLPGVKKLAGQPVAAE